MDEQELAKEIVEKHSTFPSQMNITSLLPHWPDQIMLDGVLFVQEAALRTAQERVAQLEAAVDEWQASALLSNSSGDPDGITPADNERNITQLMNVYQLASALDQSWEGDCLGIFPQVWALHKALAQLEPKGEGDESENI